MARTTGTITLMLCRPTYVSLGTLQGRKTGETFISDSTRISRDSCRQLGVPCQHNFYSDRCSCCAEGNDLCSNVSEGVLVYSSMQALALCPTAFYLLFPLFTWLTSTGKKKAGASQKNVVLLFRFCT